MEPQQYKDRIAVDPDIMLGKPVIKGTRVTIELILKKLSEGMTVEELLEAYPHLTKEDIFAALSYSADVISQEELIAS
ncbi:MAG: antitoxin [Deltaproteobacteria bacterium GWC2_42_51]|nr:MAG: antitoxin [Deltaproteobacteria bacterium GWB2_42_7]OGP34030.1 MAG: antitoxin [Deltaproteobacteria bacterium GWC2_42_51]OGP37895.1 MAG: antitoxin [Deltaproteobacteria bacterium GWD2_42_10]OGP48050.1 MAG: antitoxin [Deltaproteobacteria bacterium GWF2_42_12]OGQ29772.1 MAG: antitoxin [Deltaproteobacteria bacterium RIFCSPHIGHO2_02_FULL_42_44]OGQ38724.1 MAG: antitoxin [Deltaproteobacteria bacterium RIFCSPLOWO2_02_FULL_42_39]OGQ65281.1 MAG: antitoxin [Deltaproteobacteria bacterium RIFCSPLOWO